jgi:hypothetical protein
LDFDVQDLPFPGLAAIEAGLGGEVKPCLNINMVGGDERFVGVQ